MRREELGDGGDVLGGHGALDHFLAVEPLERDVLGVLEDFRQRSALRMTENPVAVVKIAIVQLHEAQGDQTVEPSVGHGLHRVVEPIEADEIKQLLAQRHDGSRKWLTADEGHITGFAYFLHTFRLDAEHGGTAGHRSDEGSACGGGVGLETGEIHLIWMRSPRARVLVSSVRSLVRNSSTSSELSRKGFLRRDET